MIPRLNCSTKSVQANFLYSGAHTYWLDNNRKTVDVITKCVTLHNGTDSYDGSGRLGQCIDSATGITEIDTWTVGRRVQMRKYTNLFLTISSIPACIFLLTAKVSASTFTGRSALTASRSVVASMRSALYSSNKYGMLIQMKAGNKVSYYLMMNDGSEREAVCKYVSGSFSEVYGKENLLHVISNINSRQYRLTGGSSMQEQVFSKADIKDLLFRIYFSSQPFTLANKIVVAEVQHLPGTDDQTLKISSSMYITPGTLQRAKKKSKQAQNFVSLLSEGRMILECKYNSELSLPLNCTMYPTDLPKFVLNKIASSSPSAVEKISWCLNPNTSFDEFSDTPLSFRSIPAVSRMDTRALTMPKKVVMHCRGRMRCIGMVYGSVHGSKFAYAFTKNRTAATASSFVPTLTEDGVSHVSDLMKTLPLQIYSPSDKRGVHILRNIEAVNSYAEPNTDCIVISVKYKKDPQTVVSLPSSICFIIDRKTQ